MPFIERVSRKWERVSFVDLCWKTIAFERKINRDTETPSFRAKVLSNFGPYYKAACVLFPHFSHTVQTNLDKAISNINLTYEARGVIHKNMTQLFQPI